MNHKITLLGKITLVSAAVCGFFSVLSPAFAQGTAFTYQGQLQANGIPVTGNYDFKMQVYDASTNGAVIGGPITNTAVSVNNGLFTTEIDFGPGVLVGGSNWLHLAVQTNGGNGFVSLLPRQQLTPVPYAVFAEGANAAGLTGTIPMSSLSGTYGEALDLTNAGNSFAGNGAGLSNVNAGNLGGISASSFWQLGGNTAPGGSFLGTLNNQVLDLVVDNVRALRFRLTTDWTGFFTNAPNIIMGSSINSISVTNVGGTISGGGANYMNGNSYPNQVTADFATIGGGFANTASGAGSVIGGGGTDGTSAYPNLTTGMGAVIGGGLNNTNLAVEGTIGGGFGNSVNSTIGGFFSGGSTVGGGEGNSASTDQATVGGGLINKATGYAATVPGGSLNIAGGTGSFAAGQSAQTTHDGTFIWGDGTQAFTGANADDAFNVLATGGVFFYDGSNGVSVDHGDLNNGSIYYGLRFGEESGEGMASKRTAGGNQYGLDFYTGFNNRMCISSSGFVGINTTTPGERLEVNGNYAQIDGGTADDGSGAIDAYIGGSGSGSDVQVGSMNSSITGIAFWNQAAGAFMHIGCSSISINGGSDLAEPFPISSAKEPLSEGSVMVIDPEHPGRLKLSSQPYDTRVAGVLSGANGINPGIQMQQQGMLEGGKNVALSGRVYVLADCHNGPIAPGDLLTTSSNPGHAMKVRDHARAEGAILGKAMTGLNGGQGMVLALVTLQ